MSLYSSQSGMISVDRTEGLYATWVDATFYHVCHVARCCHQRQPLNVCKRFTGYTMEINIVAATVQLQSLMGRRTLCPVIIEHTGGRSVQGCGMYYRIRDQGEL